MPDRTPPITDGHREARCVSLSRVEVRTADDGQVTVAGYAAVFDSASEDLGGFVEVLKQGAFRKALNAGADVRLLINHEGLPLARTKNDTLRLSEDPKGLHIEADLSDTALARDLTAALERGDVDQMSFAFTVAPEGREWTFPDDPNEPAMRTIYEVDGLFDVSAVTFPAYPATEIGVRGFVCGQAIATADGALDRALFDDVCKRIADDDLTASLAERRELDRAAEQLSTITPWQRERAFRATGKEPESNGAAVDVPGGAQDEVTTEQDSNTAFGLDVRRRRFAQTERHAPPSCA